MALPWFSRRSRKQPQRATSRPCPHCGEPVSSRALACRSCGSDAQTGWAEDADNESVDLGTNADPFDYEEFLAREFPQTQKPALRAGQHARKAAFVLLLATLILALLFARA